jgi:nucleotide-binding universal stress UspA family protein
MEDGMHLRHIVAATDESDAGRQAIWTARALAARAGARVTVLRVVPLDDCDAPLAIEQLRRWAEADLPALDPAPEVAYALACGLPGIEIGRFAEQAHADLVVLGRKQRSRMARLLLGDTGDAVARRSRVSCLFVPPRSASIRKLLVALEGSERGSMVLRVADRLARQVGAELRLVTVEPVYAGEPAQLAAATADGRSARARSLAYRTLGREIEVRRGEPAEQILEAIHEFGPDVLVLGCHRGGPAGLIECGSTARRLIHTAPCAVLTVPL